MSALQSNFGSLFEDYRKLVVASLKLEQDRDRLSDQHRAKTDEAESFRTEATSLRRELETARIHLTKAVDDAESSEKRNHLLEIARKEAEQQLATASYSLRAVSDEAESQKLELISLRQQVEADAGRITDLSAKHHEAYEKSLLLAERCDNYESTLKSCYDQISALQGNIESLTQERQSGKLCPAEGCRNYPASRGYLPSVRKVPGRHQGEGQGNRRSQGRE